MMEKEEIAKKIDWFAEHMKKQMFKPRNMEKGGWKGDSFVSLLLRLEEEFAELAGVCAKDGAYADPQKVLKEACDVANFAMMIADNFSEHEQEH